MPDPGKGDWKRRDVMVIPTFRSMNTPCTPTRERRLSFHYHKSFHSPPVTTAPSELSQVPLRPNLGTLSPSSAAIPPLAKAEARHRGSLQQTRGDVSAPTPPRRMGHRPYNSCPPTPCLLPSAVYALLRLQTTLPHNPTLSHPVNPVQNLLPTSPRWMGPPPYNSLPPFPSL